VLIQKAAAYPAVSKAIIVRSSNNLVMREHKEETHTLADALSCIPCFGF
jgi:DNA-directed RNA polymerase subunit L